MEKGLFVEGQVSLPTTVEGVSTTLPLIIDLLLEKPVVAVVVVVVESMTFELQVEEDLYSRI